MYRNRILYGPILCGLLALGLPLAAPADEAAEKAAEKADVRFDWGVKIPLRDGVELAATLYRPLEQQAPLPCVFTLTPYVSATYHARGQYFAANGYVFLTVDARGRGNSGGEFTPLLQEAKDGHDVVQWLAAQPYCNGKVTMWGGSYAGYDQWATAKEFPPALATIVPVASPKAGVDFPMRNNMFYSYLMQWYTYVSGHTAQETIFSDGPFWQAAFGRWYREGKPFRELDRVVGNPSPNFQTWIAHPQQDAYWDSFNPTAEQYAALDLPILSITGQYDGDQPGALAHYRDHMRYGSEQARARHFLIIGPWNHAGTRTPRAEFDGRTFGPASLVDMNALHKAWYDWTLKDGARPEFLKDRVAYYVGGEEAWRYAPTLDAITARRQSWYLDSVEGRANDVFASGDLRSEGPGRGRPDGYVEDPAVLQPQADDEAGGLTSQRDLLAAGGRLLVYHTPPFAQDTDIAGFFRLGVWLQIDQPDTDFVVGIYELRADGSSVLLTSDQMRARYRHDLREAQPVRPGAIERYDFDRFTFAAQRIAKGSRLRLAIGPVNTPYAEKNYNTGGVVAAESRADARKVAVRLYHDARHPSVLEVPLAASSSVAVAAKK